MKPENEATVAPRSSSGSHISADKTSPEADSETPDASRQPLRFARRGVKAKVDPSRTPPQERPQETAKTADAGKKPPAKPADGAAAPAATPRAASAEAGAVALYQPKTPARLEDLEAARQATEAKRKLTAEEKATRRRARVQAAAVGLREGFWRRLYWARVYLWLAMAGVIASHGAMYAAYSTADPCQAVMEHTEAEVRGLAKIGVSDLFQDGVFYAEERRLRQGPIWRCYGAVIDLAADGGIDVDWFGRDQAGSSAARLDQGARKP